MFSFESADTDALGTRYYRIIHRRLYTTESGSPDLLKRLAHAFLKR